MVSGILFADDFVGISGTSKGLQEQIEIRPKNIPGNGEWQRM